MDIVLSQEDCSQRRCSYPQMSIFDIINRLDSSALEGAHRGMDEHLPRRESYQPINERRTWSEKLHEGAHRQFMSIFDIISNLEFKTHEGAHLSGNEHLRSSVDMSASTTLMQTTHHRSPLERFHSAHIAKLVTEMTDPTSQSQRRRSPPPPRSPCPARASPLLGTGALATCGASGCGA